MSSYVFECFYIDEVKLIRILRVVLKRKRIWERIDKGGRDKREGLRLDKGFL